MDRADRALLAALQADSSRSLADLAERVNLSSSACHRRIRSLEEQGLILGYAARVDARRLGLSVEVFVEITLNSQSREAMDRFERAVCDFDEILECHLMSGAADYQLRVAAVDLDHYDRIHRDCLARLPGVSSMRTSFSLRRIKRFEGYAVPGA
ncbi:MULTISPECIES: Lrp/AsnC family transcriptional regulator [Novosphingobium]|uniref:AsnC family transcriptional regulator n=1 Tax=Novosphingobium pentaromativorans US6-1 TaxID=1088721 RepID=G6ECB0_9SPHN|nr:MULTISPECIES: Lrp/AsnC family transcriptional regulator [Novosphingobium]AIT80109.1 AsnC family transcriptional regulator [Novosphingobium pentaromativorans US6-1]EHJ61045.1 AsnC family transcriptional regulator [Novosphingobium pentaromativorans US6-1]GFM27856.1 AsnC family transcriptional regulator [Novosphingobium sp. PY1]CCA94240.1 AsnC family transcriptional regulator [Novosphingobium sp. PP1Y]